MANHSRSEAALGVAQASSETLRAAGQIPPGYFHPNMRKNRAHVGDPGYSRADDSARSLYARSE